MAGKRINMLQGVLMYLKGQLYILINTLPVGHLRMFVQITNQLVVGHMDPDFRSV